MKSTLKMTAVALAALGASALFAHAQSANDVDFGDDSSLWAEDGECDDPRFEGDGMADLLDDADLMSDATDCREAYLAGDIRLIGQKASAPLLNKMRPPKKTSSAAVEFGDDDSFFSLDGECDDARFIGEAMADGPYWAESMFHDATDCKDGMDAGELRLRGDGDPSIEEVTEDEELTEDDIELFDQLAALLEGGDLDDSDPADIDAPPADGIRFNGVNFGDDEGSFSNDGECDDPRFTGEGMTGTTLLAEDAYHDATDCLAAWKQGGLELSDF
ncbi:hypothetical protein [Henriciella litoralis]|uniref:hypothetical protein n=1 Tax=Henriciella litoralis TaxID=568102 RepID=UPI00111C39F3|nr:hypothetical protein [Henriciella litoralis]